MRWPAAILFVSAHVWALGCASAPTPTPTPAVRADDDVDALKERLARVERRLADVDARLGLLLAQRAGKGPRTPVAISTDDVGRHDLGPSELIVEDPPREEASLGARAALRSVDLGPRPRPADDEISDPAPPRGDASGDSGEAVVIRMTGDGAATVGEGPPDGAMPEELYAWAQARLKSGRALEAVTALEEIERRFPGHDLADNAAYWIAWAHQSRGDHRLALQVWERLPLRYPRSSKVPDALFGMAQSHEALGEPAVAETLYEQVVRRFPKAEKVREAKAALVRLRPR
ncbi:MAG: tetratricopeptide repeat protein [Deltaproteobacteria bacterium]|nr:tetratricopeptide repeat protein [Deltaproteobacteria bacterium]